MNPRELARLIREFLIRAEKRSALLLLREFEEMKDELAVFFLENGIRLEQLDEVMEEARRQVLKRSARFASIVADAQRHVVKETGKALNAYLRTSIFEPDVQAVGHLIGRAQDGGTLTEFFRRLEAPIREAAKQALIGGFEEGLGARQIASRLKEAADIGYGRALTISRTETNEAYRAASREMYQGAGIKKYVWVAVLDPRTCLICWRLHGTKWNSSRKIFSHPNCRCTMIPVTEGMDPVETGVDRFAKLEPGYQKQILGPKRFELFQAGSAIDSFIGSKRSEEFGTRYHVRPLSTS